jgi:signal transduction histidine kinase
MFVRVSRHRSGVKAWHDILRRLARVVPVLARGIFDVALELKHMGESGHTPAPIRIVQSADQARSAEDLQLAQALEARAALAIENARLAASLESTQLQLEQTAREVEAQAEEMQTTMEELEAKTQELERANGELTEAREKAERALADAEEANAAKSQFLATMSHELRTPLNAIDGYAELMELGIHGPLTEPQRDSLRRMRRAQKRLLSLVNDVLNFSKLESGLVFFDLREVAVADVCEGLEAVIAPQVALRAQVLVIDAVPPGLTVYGDPERIEQILINILANAIKFTPEGGHIELSAHDRGTHADIVVRDTGMGIPPDRISRIFEPFVQVSTGMVRDSGGVGLGLSISRDLARAMHGEIHVESVLGKGSAFTLRMPRHPPDA